MLTTRRAFLMAAGAAAAFCGSYSFSLPSPAPTTSPSPLDQLRIDPATVVGKDGFYRVGKSTAGRWWLIAPDGRPFLYRGVCALYMPDGGGGSEAAAYRKRWEQVNGADKEKFVAHCMDILSGLGFNAFGEWTTSYFRDRGWPYTVLIHVRKETGNEFTIDPPKHIDLFDPAWQKAYEGRCKGICTPLRGKKDLVGYFIDNEASWAQIRKDFVWEGKAGAMVDRNVLGHEPLLLQHFLALDEKRAGHRAAWDFVLKRHGGSIAQVAKDWSAEFDSPGKLIESHKKGMVLASKAFVQDHEAFTTFFTREYFRITSEAIRRYDPNHLLLGCRHGGPPGDVVMRAYDRRHVDVVSFNNYRPNFKERADEYYRPTQMPMLNGEFAWVGGSFLNWNKITKLQSFTPEEREKVRKLAVPALENAFTHPGLIGYTWYKFCYRFPTPDDPSYGLIDPTGQHNAFNRELLRQINPRLEAIAMGQG